MPLQAITGPNGTLATCDIPPNPCQGLVHEVPLTFVHHLRSRVSRLSLQLFIWCTNPGQAITQHGGRELPPMCDALGSNPTTTKTNNHPNLLSFGSHLNISTLIPLKSHGKAQPEKKNQNSDFTRAVEAEANQEGMGQYSWGNRTVPWEDRGLECAGTSTKSGECYIKISTYHGVKMLSRKHLWAVSGLSLITYTIQATRVKRPMPTLSYNIRK